MISIIIPYYNKGSTIERCIKSVIQQNFTEFEIIIIDDGSSDENLEIISIFANNHPQIKLFSQLNQGPGAARNFGAIKASGSWLLFLDADDYLAFDTLTTFIHLILSNPGYEAVLFASQWTNEPEPRVIVKSLSNSKPLIWQFEKLTPTPTVYQLEAVLNFFVMGSIIISREIFNKYGGFYHMNKCAFGEDAFLWLPILLNEKILVTRHVGVFIDPFFSELGIGRRVKPIPAYLLQPDYLLNTCPSNFKTLLIQFFNYKAFRHLQNLLFAGNIRMAFWLYRKYPKLVEFRNNDFPPILISFFYLPLLKILSQWKKKILSKFF